MDGAYTPTHTRGGAVAMTARRNLPLYCAQYVSRPCLLLLLLSF
jgi:hypothetical protein